MKKILIKHIRKISVIVLAFVLFICGGCSDSTSNNEKENLQKDEGTTTVGNDAQDKDLSGGTASSGGSEDVLNEDLTYVYLNTRSVYDGEQDVVWDVKRYYDEYGNKIGTASYNEELGDYDDVRYRGKFTKEGNTYVFDGIKTETTYLLNESGEITQITVTDGGELVFRVEYADKDDATYKLTEYEESMISSETYYNEEIKSVYWYGYKNGKIWRNSECRYSERGNRLSYILYDGAGKENVISENISKDEDYDENGMLLYYWAVNEFNQDVKVYYTDEELKKQREGYNSEGELVRERHADYIIYYEPVPVKNDALLVAFLKIVRNNNFDVF